VIEEAVVHWGLLCQKQTDRQREGDVPCNIFILFLSPEILLSFLLSDTFNCCSVTKYFYMAFLTIKLNSFSMNEDLHHSKVCDWLLSCFILMISLFSGHSRCSAAWNLT